MGQRYFMRIVTKKGIARVLLSVLWFAVVLLVSLMVEPILNVVSVVLLLLAVVPLVTTFEGMLSARVPFVKFSATFLLVRIFKFLSHLTTCLLIRAPKVKQMNTKLPDNHFSLEKSDIGTRNDITRHKKFWLQIESWLKRTNQQFSENAPLALLCVVKAIQATRSCLAFPSPIKGKHR